jgi:hypothetical protein
MTKNIHYINFFFKINLKILIIYLPTLPTLPYPLTQLTNLIINAKILLIYLPTNPMS